jgi:predicted O-methyltransferase YrrM
VRRDIVDNRFGEIIDSMNSDYGFRMIQDRGEISQLLADVLERSGKLKIAMEIGSYDGGCLCAISSLVEDNGEVISLEPNTETFNSDRVQEVIQPVKLHHIAKFSTDPLAEEALVKILNGRTIDFLFIDGDHRYHIAKHDFITYSKYVTRVTGVVAFHDINCRENQLYAPGEEMIGCYWDVITHFRHHTEIRYTAAGSHGIGMILL